MQEWGFLNLSLLLRIWGTKAENNVQCAGAEWGRDFLATESLPLPLMCRERNAGSLRLQSWWEELFLCTDVTRASMLKKITGQDTTKHWAGGATGDSEKTGWLWLVHRGGQWTRRTSSEEEDGSGLVQQSFRGNGLSKSHCAVCSWPVVRGRWLWELLACKVRPE